MHVIFKEEVLTDSARHRQGFGRLEASLDVLGVALLIENFSRFAFKNFLFEGIFVGLSCMKTVIDRVSFLVAEGAYHSWTESMFSAEMWGRRDGVSASVM